MTVRECYEAMGADYDEVIGRLRTDDRVKKFVLKVPNDPSYDLLCTSIEKGDMDEAFRAAHTLKGICQNLSLTGLYRTVAPLSDYLKEKKEYTEEVASMMADVSEAYNLMKTSVLQLEA